MFRVPSAMTIKLGLIGNSISESRAPFLHRMLGDIYGFDVSYDLHDPMSSQYDALEATLKKLRQDGYTGCNITFPFKTLALNLVDEPDHAVRQVGATNTLVFAEGRVRATNTDYTGFIRGYRSRRGDMPAGDVLMLGAGGVGRAVAFGLFECGANRLRIYDPNRSNAQALVTAVNAKGYQAELVDLDELSRVAREVNGLVNCSPIGHYATPGIPLDPSLFGGQEWAFDAVYVPLDTEFLKAAGTAGLQLVSGFDLFFYQGIDAFQSFTKTEADAQRALGRFIKEFSLESQLLSLD